MISFARIDVNDMPWEKLLEFKGANIFHTRPWIDFLADFERAEPVVASVHSSDQVIGYFTGLITHVLGLKILGSPFRGWNTYLMGFNLMPGVSYHEVLQAFPRFAFEELKCHFLMIIDSNVKAEDLNGLSYHVRKITNYALDLDKSETELFAGMKGKSCRRSIHRAIKKGVVIEETADPGFADEYFAQLQEINARKSLPHYYGLNFVRQMIIHLLPTGNLLLLRARNSEGVSIATHIDLVFNKVAVGWGAASWQKYRDLNPNELLEWYGMKKMKAMGAGILQLGDTVKEYKEKFGAYETPAFRLMKARNSLLYVLVFVTTSLQLRIRNLIL